ncbi:hypothetical protein HDE_13088 [Halotydeus destructor]|nr:hypothetical protein HDE_13088 [Halotydeus destructor]
MTHLQLSLLISCLAIKLITGQPDNNNQPNKPAWDPRWDQPVEDDSLEQLFRVLGWLVGVNAGMLAVVGMGYGVYRCFIDGPGESYETVRRAMVRLWYMVTCRNQEYDALHNRVRRFGDDDPYGNYDIGVAPPPLPRLLDLNPDDEQSLDRALYLLYRHMQRDVPRRQGGPPAITDPDYLADPEPNIPGYQPPSPRTSARLGLTPRPPPGYSTRTPSQISLNIDPPPSYSGVDLDIPGGRARFQSRRATASVIPEAPAEPAPAAPEVRPGRSQTDPSGAGRDQSPVLRRRTRSQQPDP